MKPNILASIVIGALAATAAADPAPKGPDFASTHVPPVGVDRSLAASSAIAPIEPSELVAFALDSSRLEVGELPLIDTAARWFAAHPSSRVIVEGHTDRSGPALHNDGLALRRAEAVGARLVADGVDSGRIVIVAYGRREASPRIDSNDRRAVITASALSVDAIVRRSLANNAVAATWRERGWLVSEQPGLRAPQLAALR